MANITKCSELGKPHRWRERDEKYSGRGTRHLFA